LNPFIVTSVGFRRAVCLTFLKIRDTKQIHTDAPKRPNKENALKRKPSNKKDSYRNVRSSKLLFKKDDAFMIACSGSDKLALPGSVAF